MRLHDVAAFGFAFLLSAIGCGGVALSPDGGRGNTGTAGAGTGSAGAQGGAGTTGVAGTGVGGGAAGSNGGAGTGASGGSGGVSALGSVTLGLVVPTTTSFCDTAMCGSPGPHITISTADGKDVPTIRPVCGAFCAADGTCDQHLCTPGGACAPPHGEAYTGETINWDGTSVGTSTCGAGIVCTTLPHVADGNYVAHMCATPGTLTMSDGGFYPTCTATGPVECIDVPFTIPSATPVVGSLPGSSPCPATLPAAGSNCSTPGLICDYPGVDPGGACRPRATCVLKTPAIGWSVTQPPSTCGTHPSPCPAAFASIPSGGACPAGATPFQTACDYPEGRCGCVSCFGDASASGTMWSCRAWDAGAGASCPARAPLAGSACSVPDAFCFYGGCGEISIGSDLQCEGGYWQERGIAGTCAVPSCTPK